MASKSNSLRVVTRVWRSAAADWTGLLTSTGAAAGLILIAAIAVGTTMDQVVSDYFRSIGREVFVLARMFGDLGNSKWYLLPLLPLLAMTLLMRRYCRGTAAARQLTWIASALAFIFIAVAMPGLLVIAVKILVGRSRPTNPDSQGAGHFEPFNLDADFQSFPSGHTNTLFALALALGFFLPTARILLITLAVALSFNRVVVNAHYVTDIVAGAAVAAVVVLWLRHRFREAGVLFQSDAERGTRIDFTGRRLYAAGRRRWRRLRRRLVSGPPPARPSLADSRSI